MEAGKIPARLGAGFGKDWSGKEKQDEHGQDCKCDRGSGDGNRFVNVLHSPPCRLKSVDRILYRGILRPVAGWITLWVIRRAEGALFDTGPGRNYCICKPIETFVS
jgi:hypothetical protein